MPRLLGTSQNQQKGYPHILHEKFERSTCWSELEFLAKLNTKAQYNERTLSWKTWYTRAVEPTLIENLQSLMKQITRSKDKEKDLMERTF